MVLLWRIERPSPRAKASRISGRPAWFSISAGSACESARTKPLEVITVTRAPPADITAVHSRSAVESSDLAGACDGRGGGSCGGGGGGALSGGGRVGETSR